MNQRIFMTIILILLMMVGVVSAQEQTNADTPPNFDSWEEILEAARGTTVNWYVWGGSDAINDFVDSTYGSPLLEEYEITLNRIPLADTVDAVNQILSEAEAGIEGDAGSIDLIWINGENFFTLQQADLLYGPWAQTIPNSAFVDWENPAINLDFGQPVDGFESPWSGAQFQFIYDTARMSEDDLPRSYAQLTTWLMDNPGRYTYIAPGPGAFQGTRFVKQVLFEISGGQEQWLGDFDQELYDRWSPELWDLLNSWEPYLWREGQTYPTTENELHTLFANNEVDFTITQAISGASTYIADGLLPPTSRAYVFDDNMIGDFNYVAIPFNAPNKAAALVLANLILRPDRQALQVVPENGFGLGFAIDVSRVDDPEMVALLEDAAANLGSGAADPQALAASLVSDIAAEYQSLIEMDWEANVLQN